MSAVGSGVQEIRIHAGGAYRVFYVAKFEAVIYMLYAFQKKRKRQRSKTLKSAGNGIV